MESLRTKDWEEVFISEAVTVEEICSEEGSRNLPSKTIVLTPTVQSGAGPSKATSTVSDFNTPSGRKRKSEHSATTSKEKFTAKKDKVEETLKTLQAFLKSRSAPNKNMAFGQYIEMFLMDMPEEEQNYKKLEMMKIDFIYSIF